MIQDLLTGHLAASAIAILLLVKAGIWLVALSSGTSGGVLAPLLILGGAAGSLLGLMLPHDQGAWALIGMAAVLGGTMRAPLTGALFAVELTGEFSLLPALLAATGAAYAVTVLLLRRSMLTEKIARRGQHITREYGIDPFELARVRDIVVSEVDVLAAGLPVGNAVETMERGLHRIYPVVDAAHRPIGLLSRAEALRWQLEGWQDGETLGERVSDAELAVVHPDDVATYAIEVMVDTDQGRIPVVDPETGRLVGLITRKDLLRVRAQSFRSERERLAYFGRGREPEAATVTE